MTGPLITYVKVRRPYTYVIRISYIYTLEEWNEYATDNSTQDDDKLNADFFRRMCAEQHGHYVPFA
jgi:hypothetical protein